MPSRLLLIAALAAGAAACASGPGPDGRPDRPKAAGFQTPAALLAHARALREKDGCAAAAPAYRVVAGMGEGSEAAQHELSECLMRMTGDSALETSLLKDEGLFWLTRAAYAGNARAQRTLAMTYGAANNPSGSPEEALKWALVYEANPEAKLYGFQTLPQTFVAGLKRDLSADARAAAEAFASNFKPISMAAFEAPKIDDDARGQRPADFLPRKGRRPPRRRAG